VTNPPSTRHTNSSNNALMGNRQGGLKFAY